MNSKKIVATLMASLMAASVLAGCGNSQSAEETTTADGRIFSSKDGAYKGDIDAKTLLSYADIQDAKVTLPKDYKEMKVTLTQSFEPTADGATSYEDNVLAGTPAYETQKKKTVAKGDIVDIDYEGKINGKTFEGGTDKGYKLTIGSKSFIDGFEDGLIGHKVGETVDLNLKFPKDYGATQYAGKAVVFTVKINKIVKATTMTHKDLTDEFVKENFESKYKVTTVKDFEKKMEEEYKSNLAEQKYNNISSEVMETLINESKVKVDDAEVDKVATKRIKYVKNQAKQFGMEYKDYVKTYYGSTKKLKSAIKEAINEELILQEVVKDNNIGIKEKDFKKFVSSYLKSYQMTDEKELYDMVGGENSMKLNFAENQAISFLAGHAKVTVKEEASTQSSEVDSTSANVTITTEAENK